MSAPLAAGGSALWYLTRGTGAVTLVLLTVSVCLGVVDVRRWSSPRLPRFVVDGLHRTVSLLVVAMVVVHVVTTVVDSFAPIRLLDAVVPFVSAYRPIWIGLGALALDLLLAIALTSLVRARLGGRTWRVVHWLAYACWPVALFHALGTGSDLRGGFMLPLSLACTGAVVAAIAFRIVDGWPAQRRVRLGAGAATLLTGAGLALWLPAGPLARGWARRAGTPPSVIAAATPGGAARPLPVSLTGAGGRPPAPTTAPISGRIAEQAANGAASARLLLSVSRSPLSRLDVRIDGRALAGGGIAMTRGQVALGPERRPALYRGPITALNGTRLVALVHGPGGRSIAVTLALRIDRATAGVAGSARLVPVGGPAG